MPEDNEKVVRDLKDAIEKSEEIRQFLNDLYYNPEFSQFFNRPIISMLETGAVYLRNNMDQLLQGYRKQTGQ